MYLQFTHNMKSSIHDKIVQDDIVSLNRSLSYQ